jgi:VCBS repeat protein/Big-like domain-containing protein
MRAHLRLALAIAAVSLVVGPRFASAISVVGLDPVRLGVAPRDAAVTITFDTAVDPNSISQDSFRVFGKQSGTATGPFTFSPDNTAVTLTPGHVFLAGEVVHVNLSHDVKGADTSSLRSAGYTYQFRIATTPSSRTFTRIQNFDNRDNPGVNTHLYGAMAGDVNGDGWVDLTTVNEDSADLRVTLNKADGSGTFGPFLSPPTAIGPESSPNESCDLDNDGHIDIAVSSTDDGAVFVALGQGDGTWKSVQEVTLGTAPETHGVAVLDIDGDGDWDVVNANHAASNLAVSINTGGVLSDPNFIESGVDGEYALNAGDMNNDGIADLVVGGQDSQQIVVLLGNGDGTFTPQTPQDAGGAVWKLVLGDVNGDGNLDVAAVNGGSNSAAILLGNGDGTLVAPSAPGRFFDTSGTEVGTVLGDLDGDGDLDWVISSYGGQQWHVLVNDGTGNFSFDADIDVEDPAANPSCAIMLDVDNDGDLDLALTDETTDHTRILLNTGGPTPDCPLAPGTCRAPTVSGGASLALQQRSPVDKSQMKWKWGKGAATAKDEFGDPTSAVGYSLCVYDAGALVSTSRVIGFCTRKPCWTDKSSGFLFRNKSLEPTGVKSLKLVAGPDGKATAAFGGKGASLALPDPTSLAGPIDVQLIRSGSAVCWGSVFSAPFKKQADGVLKDRSD